MTGGAARRTTPRMIPSRIPKRIPRRNTEVDTEQVDEDELANFRPLLSHLRIENLAELAISLKTALLGADACTDNPLICTVSPLPLTGSYNILYRVTFSDGSAWIFKIPCIGYLLEWSDTSGRKLRSEANTMKFIWKYIHNPSTRGLRLRFQT